MSAARDAQRPRAAELVHASRRKDAAIAVNEETLELEGEITESRRTRMFIVYRVS